uniref:Uncharacterized protein n=1 Tax=viral metagenome TaxID=1070528 RepID=A0A6C0JVS9_9ZZZZ
MVIAVIGCSAFSGSGNPLALYVSISTIAIDMSSIFHSISFLKLSAIKAYSND